MPFSSDEALNLHLWKATSGRGIVNLHHTITRYAVERIRPLLKKEEYEHMIAAWIAFMDDKEAEKMSLNPPAGEVEPDEEQFYEIFSKWDAKPVVATVAGMISSKKGRSMLGRLLIKGVCKQYQGNYNPHYLTGLGSALWVVERYWKQAPTAMNALFQYIDFFFTGLKSER